MFITFFSVRFWASRIFIRSTLFLFLRICIIVNAATTLALNLVARNIEQKLYISLFGLAMLFIAIFNTRPKKSSFIVMFILQCIYISAQATL